MKDKDGEIKELKEEIKYLNNIFELTRGFHMGKLEVYRYRKALLENKRLWKTIKKVHLWIVCWGDVSNDADDMMKNAKYIEQITNTSNIEEDLKNEYTHID